MKRLDLYQFDGAPLNPMFLAYDPPQMLPTITMNPTAAAPSATAKAKAKRGEEQWDLPLVRNFAARNFPPRIRCNFLIEAMLRTFASKPIVFLGPFHPSEHILEAALI